MTAIRDEIGIQAPRAKVYAALTEQSGYRGWWNAVAEVSDSVGDEAKLRFVKDGHPVDMTFRIDELAAGERVRWTCTAHAMDSWVGTTLWWNLRDASGGSLVSFEHAGWKGDPPEPVVQGWKHFLASLRSYVETGTGQPW